MSAHPSSAQRPLQGHPPGPDQSPDAAKLITKTVRYDGNDDGHAVDAAVTPPVACEDGTLGAERLDFSSGDSRGLELGHGETPVFGSDRGAFTPPCDHLPGTDPVLERRGAGLTITHAHRTALRRIARGERAGDLAGLVIELADAGLVDDNHIGLVGLTDEGRALLAAHDRLAETRRVERPRLERRPLPVGWRVDLAKGYVHETGVQRGWGDQHPEDLRGPIARTRAMLELLEWIQHSRVVEAQEAGR